MFHNMQTWEIGYLGLIAAGLFIGVPAALVACVAEWKHCWSLKNICMTISLGISAIMMVAIYALLIVGVIIPMVTGG